MSATGSRAQAIQGLFVKPTSSVSTPSVPLTPFKESAIGKYVDRTIKPAVNPAVAMTWDFNNPTNPTNQKLMEANRAYHQENNAATKKSEQDIQIQTKQDMLRNAGYKIKSDGVWGSRSQAAYDDYLSKQPAPAVAPKPQNLYNKIGGGLRDAIMSSSNGVVGQAAPFVADILGVTAPMTEKSFTPEQLSLLKTIKANPNNQNIGNYKTTNAKGETIIIPANKRRENTEAHFLYYQKNGTPEQKAAASALLNTIGQGTVANMGSSKPMDYYNFNKSVNDKYAANQVDEFKQRVNSAGVPEDTTSYLKRIGTRVLGPKFGTVGLPGYDNVGQPTVLASIKTGGLIKRK
jgi:hypothetical protein